MGAQRRATAAPPVMPQFLPPQVASAAPGLSDNSEATAAAKRTAATGDPASLIELRRVGVMGIPAEILQSDIQTVFQTFGMILRCDFVPPCKPPARHSGNCYVEFAAEHSATQALQAMQGFKLAGAQLRLSRGTPQPQAQAKPDAPAEVDKTNLP